MVFCVGGRGASGDPFQTIECYDLRRDRWFPVAEMSSRRRHVGVVSVNGKRLVLWSHVLSNHGNTGSQVKFSYLSLVCVVPFVFVYYIYYIFRTCTGTT